MVRALDVIAAEYRDALVEARRTMQARIDGETVLRKAEDEARERVGRLREELMAAAHNLTVEEHREQWSHGLIPAWL